MKLYVGNINYTTTEAELRGLFADYEPLPDFFYPNDRETGQPRGFAFIQLENAEAGEAAIGQLDGYELNGRKLRVSEAREREERGGGRGGRGGGGGGHRGGGGGGGRESYGKGY